MGLTITEKILSAKVGKEVKPGEFILIKPDLIFANDITGPLAISEFKKIGLSKVFNPQKIAFVLDHFTPNKDAKTANQCHFIQDFAIEQHLNYYFGEGRGGIEHVILPDEGLVFPGEVIIGADSHTSTHGALGAFATGVGSTDVAYAMAFGEIWLKASATYKIVFQGKLKPWVGGKDLILYLISQIGVDGATYKTLEFSGKIIKQLPMADRFTLCNMAIEAGAKNGLIEPDEITLDYVQQSQKSKVKSQKSKEKIKDLKSDEDASYEKIYEWDASALEPLVACPHLPSNVRPATALGNTTIDQVVIGSCTNGRLEDLRIAAKILGRRKVAKGVRLIIIPGSQEIFKRALKEGLIETFLAAGALVSPPTCGPCLGGHMGVLAAGERCIATTNRNFKGRMGDPQSEVYLSGPAVAAASAILGRIGSPEKV